MTFYVRLEQKIQKIFFKNLCFVNMNANESEKCIDLSNENDAEIRKETEELYGLCIQDNTLYLTANGEMIPFAVPENHQSYGHNYDKKIHRLTRSGIEIETDNSFTTAVVFSLTRHVRKKYSHRNIKFDGSLHDGGLEFLMDLATWIKLLPYIKPSLKFQSTHIHFSTRPLLAYFTALNASQDEPFASLFVDLYDEWGDERYTEDVIDDVNQTSFAEACSAVFGRYFNNYATPFIRTYNFDRYAFITTPNFETSFKKIAIEKSNRVTTEIRLAKLTNIETMIYFLTFLEKVYKQIINKDRISVATFSETIFEAYRTPIPIAKQQQQKMMSDLWKKLVKIDKKLNKEQMIEVNLSRRELEVCVDFWQQAT